MAEANPDNNQTALSLSPVDLGDPQSVVDVFFAAAKANLACPLRRGCCAHLPAQGRLVISGDLHDHRDNLNKLLRLANLAGSPSNHLILHEVIHGPHLVAGRDFSIRTLARVAHLKLEFPHQVHLLQANHELAQLIGENIVKEGKSLVYAFDEGVDYIYAEHAQLVRSAMGRFIRSMLLGVRCANGVFASHSLPAQHKLAQFDLGILERALTDDDFRIGGPVYQMVWGRRHSLELAQTLAKTWSAQLFVTGHQPAEMGYEIENEAILILASDHEHGVALPIDLARTYTMENLVESIIPLAAISLADGD